MVVPEWRHSEKLMIFTIIIYMQFALVTQSAFEHLAFQGFCSAHGEAKRIHSDDKSGKAVVNCG